MARSLQVSRTGLERAKEAFKLKGWTQEYLAGAIGCSRQTVIKFFDGRTVEKRLFQGICSELGLEWGDIADLESGEDQGGETLSIDELVQTARENVRDWIHERCGTMRVLDMTQPVDLDGIYTSVNILEKIIARRGLGIEELSQNISVENFERFSLSDVREKRVPGLEAVKRYPKLMILGKPGSGKTTFLKHLALQCIEGRFQTNSIPLFITLKDFAEAQNQPDLLEYLIQLFASLGIAPNTKIKTGFLTSLLNWGKAATNQLVDLIAVEELLNQGKLLMLLDGLDEVREADSKRILQKIQEFTTQFPKNQFVITCRIAAREYTFVQFTEVEVADFCQEQITDFVNKWFKAKNDLVKAERFINKLEEDKPIQELATSPLLLTLLCLVFEESGNFPPNRSELYKEGLDVLLKKWDTKRNIERDQVYKHLSLKRKEDLLSQIAFLSFEQANYFFKQKEVEKYITQYIQNLPEASTDPETLQLDSEAVLKSIEAQHGLFVERARGIYSFSHLTFHEYFTARKLVSSVKTDTLKVLATHISETRWREVFLLTVGMLESADELLLLMKQQTDALLAGYEKLQQFLSWVEDKSRSVKVPYNSSAVRAFYSYLALARDLPQDSALDRDLARARDLPRDLARALAPPRDLARDLARDPARDLPGDLALALALALALPRDLAQALARDFVRARYLARDLAVALARDQYLTRDFALALARARAQDQDLNPELERSLQQLEDQLPDLKNKEPYEQWRKENGKTWIEQLRTIIIEHLNIAYDWQFSKEQQDLLQQYYTANNLLLDCLNSDCYVSRKVRLEIEDTLLLPIQRN